MYRSVTQWTQFYFIGFLSSKDAFIRIRLSNPYPYKENECILALITAFSFTFNRHM